MVSLNKPRKQNAKESKESVDVHTLLVSFGQGGLLLGIRVDIAEAQ